MHKYTNNPREERRRTLEARKDMFTNILIVAAFVLLLDLVCCAVVGYTSVGTLTVGIISYAVLLFSFGEIEAIKDDLHSL
jgi:hypothetical protein